MVNFRRGARRLRLWTRLSFLLALATVCRANPTVFTAFDFGTGLGFGTPAPTPNSIAKQLEFLGQVANPTKIDFEDPSYILNSVNFGPDLFGVTYACASCVSGAVGFGVTDFIPDLLSGGLQDGFNTTSGGSKFYRIEAQNFGQTSTLTLTFSTPVTAFGAYLTHIDNLGTTVVTSPDIPTLSFQLPATGNPGGPTDPSGVQFFGVVDLQPFTRIVFLTSNGIGRRDIWGIDDIILAQAVPEPSALWLSGTALPVLLLMRRRRKARS